MEMHLVHENADDNLAVVGVMIESGRDNPAFTAIWEHLPADARDVQNIAGETVNALDLLPRDRRYYRYNGSLTTPPCSEGVKWFVLTTPIEMSEAQIAAFKEIIHGNNRPVQPLNARKVLMDSAVD